MDHLAMGQYRSNQRVREADQRRKGAIMTTTQAKPILVTGATGKTGRRIVERLTSAGVPVRAGSRTAEPPFDWYDPATWDPALEGVGRGVHLVLAGPCGSRRSRGHEQVRQAGRGEGGSTAGAVGRAWRGRG